MHAPFPSRLSADSFLAAARAVQLTSSMQVTSSASPPPWILDASHSCQLLHGILEVHNFPSASVVLTGPVVERRIMDVLHKFSLVAEPFVPSLVNLLDDLKVSQSSSSPRVEQARMLFLRWDAVVSSFRDAVVAAVETRAATNTSSQLLFVFEVDENELMQHRRGQNSVVAKLAEMASIVLVRRIDRTGVFCSVRAVFRDVCLGHRVAQSKQTLRQQFGGPRAALRVARTSGGRMIALSFADPLAFGLLSRHLPSCVPQAVERGAQSTVEVAGSVSEYLARMQSSEQGEDALKQNQKVVLDFKNLLRQHTVQRTQGRHFALWTPSPGLSGGSDTLLPAGSMLLLAKRQTAAEMEGGSAAELLRQKLRVSGFVSHSVKEMMLEGDPRCVPVFVDRRIEAVLVERGLVLPLHEGMGGRARAILLQLLTDAASSLLALPTGSDVLVSDCCSVSSGKPHNHWNAADPPCLWAWLLGGPLLGFASSRL